MKRTLIGFVVGCAAILPHFVLYQKAHPGDDLGPTFILLFGGPFLGIVGAVLGFLTGRLGRKWIIGVWVVVVFFYIGFLIQNWTIAGYRRDEMRRYYDEMNRYDEPEENDKQIDPTL